MEATEDSAILDADADKDTTALDQTAHSIKFSV